MERKEEAKEGESKRAEGKNSSRNSCALNACFPKRLTDETRHVGKESYNNKVSSYSIHIHTHTQPHTLRNTHKDTHIHIHFQRATHTQVDQVKYTKEVGSNVLPSTKSILPSNSFIYSVSYTHTHIANQTNGTYMTM